MTGKLPMSLSSPPPQGTPSPRCAVCHRPLTSGPDHAGPLAYWAVRHDGRHLHLCHACHAPTDGGVYVVVPATSDDRWVPLHHPR